MDYAQAREHVDAMLDERERWSEIQALIDATDLDERERDALWLHAWSRLSGPQRAAHLKLPTPA